MVNFGPLVFVAVMSNYYFYKIISTIKSNPNYTQNYQQKHVLTICLHTLIFGNLLGLPSAICFIIAQFMTSTVILNIALVFQHLIVLVYSIGNGLMIINKDLQVERLNLEKLTLNESKLV